MITAWVVWAQHSDRSGHEFIAAFATEEEANSLRKLIDKTSPILGTKIVGLMNTGEVVEK